ncbi:MAG: 4Fe-4S dicluster domain-containing protein [Desulfobacteraceae bacterium]|nr:4Fe-4S dicluster domain-containing protein [Desulfobacteraceae bacterium]
MRTARDIKTYKKQLRESLENSFLRATLEKFSSGYKEKRAKAFDGIDFDSLRNEIAQGKDAALPIIGELLQKFKENAERAGAKVHFARDAHEANTIISSIAKDNDAEKIVKSKSMTAEETFLNDHLEKEGLKVTETDLGEWIIQLRNEGPSHMVIPAIHLSRKEVAQLFAKVTGDDQYPDDINAMVKIARKELRQTFLEADMGISGANFAIAESGTIGIVTNEGNARLTTTLPRVHVALAGIDKLIPDLKSALRILRILPKNAAGQAISSYVTWITGAVECDSSPTGLKEMHIVFLDNGRMKLASDPVFSEALRCIRCGACANVCPIYGLVGGHKYGHVYIGAIGLILTYFYHGRENARAIVQNCLNCQACKAVCPGGIDLPHLIKKVYRTVLDDEKRRPVKNMVLSSVMRNRKLFHFLLRQAWLVQKPLARGEPMIRHLPLFFAKEHGFRSLPVIARNPFRDQWNELRPRVRNPRYKIAFFGGCVVDFVYPEQAEALLILLEKYSVQVEYPMEQTCCGLPAMMATEEETAKQVAVQNLKAVEPEKYDYILTLCASCGSHLKENYPKILGESDPDLKKFTGKIIDFSSFMVNVLKVSSDHFRNSKRKVAYHAPCHLCRGLNVTEEPRELLREAGLEYVPAKDEDVCCGFGGSYSVDFPEISSEILSRKLNNAEDTGAEFLVTDCPGCVMQLRGGVDKRESRVEVKHIAEIIAEEK